MMKTTPSYKSNEPTQHITSHTENANWFQDVLGYCEEITSGKRLAALTEIAACNIFLADFEKSKTSKSFKFKFDFTKAYKAIAFIEQLPHVKGHFANAVGANRLLQLRPWQKFIVANIFGWVSKATELRRYNVVYLRIPRKNGKSVLAAGIGLYMLCADGETGAEVFCGAGSLKQADEVVRPVKKMVQKTPSLKRAYGLDDKARSILRPDGSKFEPVIGKPGDGASPSCAIVDEYHEHPTADLYDTMVTGMGARQQPLMLVITTSGSNLFSPCYEMDKDAVNVLLGLFKWPELFTVCYGLDDGDDWRDPQMLIKANPNYGVSVGPDFVKAQQKLAIQKASKQNSFKTKHLNVWCNAKAAYFNVMNWQLCHDSAMKMENFTGESCWIGLDLAKKRDLSAKILLFKREIGGLCHYYVFTRFYICEAQIIEQENPVLQAMFTNWQNDGFIDVCDGNEQDFNRIRDDVIDDSHSFHVEEVPHDPWGATQISHDLEAANLLPVMIPQHGSHLTIPINELEAAIDARRIHHDGNPVMAWCVSNVIVHEYKSERKMPDKETNDSKIDGVSALLNALARAISPQEEEPVSEIIFL
jgi:phage terminase large subunit-like protein